MKFSSFIDGLKNLIRKKENPKLHEISVSESDAQPMSPPQPELTDPQYTLNKILILPTESLTTLNQFVKEDDKNRELVYWYILYQINKAIKTRTKILDVFKFKNSEMKIRIVEKDFEITIRDIREFYVKLENYEKAEVCQKVLERHRANLLLDSLSLEKSNRQIDEHR